MILYETPWSQFILWSCMKPPGHSSSYDPVWNPLVTAHLMILYETPWSQLIFQSRCSTVEVHLVINILVRTVLSVVGGMGKEFYL